MKAKIAMYLKVLYIHNDEVKLSIPDRVRQPVGLSDSYLTVTRTSDESRLLSPTCQSHPLPVYDNMLPIKHTRKTRNIAYIAETITVQSSPAKIIPTPESRNSIGCYYDAMVIYNNKISLITHI